MDILFLLRGQSILVYSFVITHSLCYVSDHLWIYKPELENMTASSGYKVRIRSSLECGRTCSLNVTCISFFVMPNEHLNCQLLDSVLDVTDGISYLQRSRYYVLDGAGLTSTSSPPTTTITTTTTTTTPPPAFSCPPDDSIYRTVRLTDGEHYTYKVVKTQRTQSGAQAACNAEEAFLSRVKTVAKMNMLLDLIIHCPGYGGSIDYYVDGSNEYFQNTPSWKFIDDSLVPMTNDFWGFSFPNNPSSEHCLRMRAEVNFMWDDCPCSRSYYFICEK